MAASNLMIQRALLAKREATAYSAETLTASEGLGDIADLGFLSVDAKRIDNKNNAKLDFGNVEAQHDTGAAVMSLAVSVPVRAAPSAGAVPANVAELLAGLCGLSETITASTSVVYAPVTPTDLDAAPSCSLALYEAGKSIPFTGARGSFRLSAKTNERAIMAFEVKAPYTLPTANQTVPSVSASSGDALVLSGAVAVTEGGTSVDISSIEFDFGGEIVEHHGSNSTKIFIRDNAPKITINPVALTSAVEWDALMAATSVAIVANFSSGGMILNIPTAQLVDMSSEDRSGRIGRSKTFECLGGDSAFTLTF